MRKNTRKPRVAETLRQAVSMLKADGIEVTAKLLGKARADGLPGFRGSRVVIAKLLPALVPWLKQRAAVVTAKEALEIRKLQIQIERMEREDARTAGDWIEWAKVEAWQKQLADRTKWLLRDQLVNQLPPKIEGLRAPEIAVKMEPVIAQIIELMRKPPESKAEDPG